MPIWYNAGMRKPNDKCSICKKAIYRRPSDRRDHPTAFCSSCKVEHSSFAGRKASITRYKRYIAAWKRGERDGMKGRGGISNHIRRYLFTRSSSACEQCGWSEINQYTTKVPLEVHHIDGDHINNTEENLALLCPNCHSLTGTYKSRGKGRPRNS